MNSIKNTSNNAVKTVSAENLNTLTALLQQLESNDDVVARIADVTDTYGEDKTALENAVRSILRFYVDSRNLQNAVRELVNSAE
jgi:hypothetical protein